MPFNFGGNRTSAEEQEPRPGMGCRTKTLVPDRRVYAELDRASTSAKEARNSPDQSVSSESRSKVNQEIGANSAALAARARNAKKTLSRGVSLLGRDSAIHAMTEWRKIFESALYEYQVCIFQMEEFVITHAEELTVLSVREKRWRKSESRRRQAEQDWREEYDRYLTRHPRHAQEQMSLLLSIVEQKRKESYDAYERLNRAKQQYRLISDQHVQLQQSLNSASVRAVSARREGIELSDRIRRIRQELRLR